MLTVLLVTLLCTTTVASAHRLSGKPTSLRGKLTLAKAQVRHDRAALRSLRFRSWTLVGPLDFALVSHHAWLRSDVAYMKRLAARLRPAHYNGWVCIHRLEGAWNDAGHPYYGGLQMSWNWMSAVPGGDAGRLSPLSQMWIAEHVSARHGFSWSWMQGQWPRTFPPCARWF
jgi:hypothetical protein